jgi:hypothetical protein
MLISRIKQEENLSLVGKLKETDTIYDQRAEIEKRAQTWVPFSIYYM